MIIKRLAIAAVAIVAASSMWLSADRIVVLHTNDTHSSIDPEPNGRGGVLQRKAIVDSVRKAEKNVLLIDAGDAVQGSLYFNFFGGEVEYPLMNMFNYDVRLLGNHEFDNGLESMAKYWKDVKGARLSANYDFTDTPLKGMFEPYVIKKIAGKKIGIFALNVDPANLISKENYTGLKFKDVIATANEVAHMLKHDKKCDLVVCVTHIGYEKENAKTTDVELAQASRDIDMIIGGHSHTVITPEGTKFPSHIKNLEGRDILVVQTGKSGRFIGRIVIDTDKLASGIEALDYSLIPVTDRFSPEQYDKKMVEFLKPYKHAVDSVNARVIAKSSFDLDNSSRVGGYPNWIADFAEWYGKMKIDSVGVYTDIPMIGIMNVGGIRSSMYKGDVTEGQMLSTFPFSNKMCVIKVKGSDIIEAMEMAASKGGEAVSENVRVVTTPDKKVVRVVVDNNEIVPDKDYLVSTITYVAQGNDDFTSLTRGEMVWEDDVEMKAPIMRYVYHTTDLGLPIAPDLAPRFVEEVVID